MRLIVIALLGALLAGCGGAPQNASAPPGPATPATPRRAANALLPQLSPFGEPTARPRSEHLFTYDIPLSQLRNRQDAILSSISGNVGEGMLGKVHDLSEDEDLHFSLNAPVMNTPVVCELMNALSVPPEAQQDHAYWEDRFARLFSTGAPVTVRGVFRLWPDHASSHDSEEPAAPTSNPPHVLEIHPVSGVSAGGLSFDTRASIAPITFDGEEYPYKDPGRWGDMLSHDIHTSIIRRDGKEYLELQTPQVGFNYWRLGAQVVDPPAAVSDGHRFTVRVVTPTRVYREVVRCFTVTGSPADRQMSELTAGKEVTLAAIGRFDLSILLSSDHYDGPIPVELCVFGINPPNLPTPARGSEAAYRGARYGRYQSGTTGGRYGRYQGGTTGARYRTAASSSAEGRYGVTGTGPIIGNVRTHIYHNPGDTRLPAGHNRVYFKTAAEAAAAGYRPARGT